MTDDTQPEDPAGELDLSAWQPPDPPVGFADGVVARARVAEHLPLGAARSAPLVAVAALVVAVLALVGEVSLHGTRLFVGDEDDQRATRADIERLDAEIRILDAEVGELQKRPIAVEPVTTTPPVLVPAPAPPPPVEPERPHAAAVETGGLAAASTPPGIVLVDNREVGQSPWRGSVPVGRHKITFAIGADKYSFFVMIKAGETVMLNKDFGPP